MSQALSAIIERTGIIGDARAHRDGERFAGRVAGDGELAADGSVLRHGQAISRLELRDRVIYQDGRCLDLKVETRRLAAADRGAEDFKTGKGWMKRT